MKIMIHQLKNNSEIVLASILFVISFVIYFVTMAPTVSFWDTGEFIATSHIMGIPHPPGSPLFLLLGKIFSLIPISKDIAFRVNLLSVISSSLTISILFLINNQILDRIGCKNIIEKFGSSFIASLTFAFSHSHWFNSVETEVYALSGLFTALVVYLSLLLTRSGQSNNQYRYIILIIYLLGLASGLHLLNLLTIPFILMIIYFSKNQNSNLKQILSIVFFSLVIFFFFQNFVVKGVPFLVASAGYTGMIILLFSLSILFYYFLDKKNILWATLFLGIFLILLGYSSYTTIVIRSSQNPAIDENNPETISSLISYLNRDQYGEMNILPRKFDNIPSSIEVSGAPLNGQKFSFEQKIQYAFYNFPDQLQFFWNYQIKKMYIRYLLWQFAGKGDSTDPLVTSMGANSNEDGVDWIQFGLPLGLMFGLFGIYSHFRKNKLDASAVMILFLMTGIAITIYLNQENPQARERDYSYVASFMTFAIWISVGIASFIELIKKFFISKNEISIFRNIFLFLLLLLIPMRMLLANFDDHNRRGNYIAWDMAYNILQTCDENAILFTNGDNDTFPLWYLQFVEKIRTDVTIVNLSLLNTPWYIEQLKRENSQKQFIKMSDAEIQNIDFIRWEKKLMELKAPKDENNLSGRIEWELPPTYLNAALRVQDLMVLRIINDNDWSRPIYFAVTVSPTSLLNLDNYLQMEGLAYRLMNNDKEVLNKKKMKDHYLNSIAGLKWTKNFHTRDNFYNNISTTKQSGYLFRNLANSEVYIDPQLGRLVQNYRTGYVRLSIAHYLDGENDQAEQILLDMDNKIPSNVIPIFSKELQYQISQLYNALGNVEQSKYHLDQLIQNKDLSIEDYLLYGRTYIQLYQDYSSASVLFETIYRNFEIAENIIKKSGIKKTKLTKEDWLEWQENTPEVVYLLYLSYKELERYDDGILLLEGWLKRNPQDLEAQNLLDELVELSQS